MMSTYCSKHVEAFNKLIMKQDLVHQVTRINYVHKFSWIIKRAYVYHVETKQRTEWNFWKIYTEDVLQITVIYARSGREKEQ